jgi:small multidrug resistance family-3 protein
MMATVLSLILAALLEVGGDAAIRRGLVRSAPPWLVLGACALLAYGLAVNLNRVIDFGRLMGAYIAVFFLVSQVISVGLFAERPSLTRIVGGVLIVAGGVVIQLGGGDN